MRTRDWVRRDALGAPTRTANPSSSNRKLTCAITVNQMPADRTSARPRWSAKTSAVEASAINSQHNRNDTASAHAGTASSANTRTAKDVHISGDSAADPRAYPIPNTAVATATKRQGETDCHLRLRSGERRRAHPDASASEQGHSGPAESRTNRGRREPGGQQRNSEHGPTHDEEDRNCGHRPVTVRSISMIAAGRGGHPATSPSTGMTVDTGPTTP